jgi:hypothetical protein
VRSARRRWREVRHGGRPRRRTGATALTGVEAMAHSNMGGQKRDRRRRLQTKRARVRRGGFRSSERVRRGFGLRLDRGAALTVRRTRGERSRGSAPGGRCHLTSGPGTGLRATNQRAPHVRGFQISGKLKNTFPHKKNRYKVRKNLRKIMEVGNPIWRNFCDYNSLRFSMDFELFQRF